jgi:hypothetical protein
MQINPIVTQANGIISIVLQPTFVGSPNDASDKAKIAAFGDPLVNIAGSFVDPNNPSFTFAFPTTEMWVGVTTQLSSQTVRFMEALPSTVNPNQPAPVQGPLDCITTNPSEALLAWYNVMAQQGPNSRIGQAMAQLRSNMLVPALPPSTV